MNVFNACDVVIIMIISVYGDLFNKKANVYMKVCVIPERCGGACASIGGRQGELAVAGASAV